MENIFSFQPIGCVESDIRELQRDPVVFEDTVARIRILPEFRQGLYHIDQFSRLYVIFVFDRSVGYELVIHPRGDPERPRRGVFATHSPNRPNPIGLAVVEVVSVDDEAVTVRGLDAIDGTPVLDIKQCDQ